MSSPALEAIDHIHINVTDRAAAETWYRETLGFVRDPAFEPWVTAQGPLTLANAAGTIHLALFERPAVQNTVVAFRVSAAALAAWIAYLSARDVAVEPIDHDLAWSIYFRDPDGNPFEITTYDYAAFGQRVR